MLLKIIYEEEETGTEITYQEIEFVEVDNFELCKISNYFKLKLKEELTDFKEIYILDKGIFIKICSN